MLSKLAMITKADDMCFPVRSMKYEAVFYLYVIAAGGVQEHYKINFISTHLQNLSM